MKSGTLNQLNKEQREAVNFGEGPLLIVAGAGTGKTTVITQRVVRLIETKKAKPEEILALTFTDKAAGEMEERVDKLLPYGYIELWISTFHSFCERILKNYALDIGIPLDFKLLDQTAAWVLVRQNFDKFNLNYYRPLGNPTKFIHALLNHFSRCKDEGIYPDDYLKYSDELKLNFDDIPAGSKAVEAKDKKELAAFQQEFERIKEVANAYHTYQQILLKNNCLDFGDLINYCLKLFRERPAILEKYRQQFKYILVDEFQDTNWVQYELVKLLAYPKNNLTVCADDDQSVYMWRGSSLNNVLQFRKDYPEAKEVILKKNYRSSQNILDLAYKFIQLNNPNRLEYQLNNVAEIAKIAKEKGVDLKNFKRIDKRLEAEKKDEGIIEYLHFRTSEEEVQGVLEKIGQLLKEDKTANFNDFAILVRANEMARPFCRALERANIPYQFLASRGLYTKPIILDIISYFKLLNNFYDDAAFYRVLNLPCLKIPYEDISRIIQYCSRHTLSVYESLQQLSLIKGLSSQAITQINHILGLLQKHSSLIGRENVSRLFVNFLTDSGYLNYLVRRSKGDIDLVNQFFNKIKQYENTQNEPSLANFIGQIEMEIESGEEGSLEFNIEEGPETIKIMTIHSAKGLEFKYVFLVNLTDKRFPTIERKEPIEIPERLVKEITPEGDVHLQEERRLFYVGMTRAKKGLFFSSADNYGGVKNKKPSRFLYECGMLEKEKKEVGFPPIGGKPTSFRFMVKRKSVPRYSLPDHFSYTQLAAFEKCPLQYKFAHILKIPRRGKANFSFGKTIHNTLYEFVNLVCRGKAVNQKDLFGTEPHFTIKNNFTVEQLVSFEDLLRIYKKNWLDEWYESKSEKCDYYKTGKQILKNFYDNFLRTKPEIYFIQGLPALEQNFNLKIGGSTIIGRIDRIDKCQDGSCEIIDYKTGKAKEKLSTEDKKQLLIYQLAAEKVLGLKPSKLTYYYLERGSSLSFLGKDAEKKSLEKNIIETIEKIKTSDFPPKPGHQCKYCDFKDICEYRSNQ